MPDVVVHTYNSSTKDIARRIPEAHWPTRQLKSGSVGKSERSCVNKQGVQLLLDDAQGCTLASTNTYAHMNEHMLTHRAGGTERTIGLDIWKRLTLSLSPHFSNKHLPFSC